jgi:hypothetical protein
MLYLTIWILFATFSAVIASSKNRSGVGWFIIGFLFGPFGLIVAALPKIETHSKVEPKKNTTPCKKCNEDIIHNSKVCRFCSTKFPHLSEPIRSHVQLISEMYISTNNPSEISDKLNIAGPQCAANNGKWTEEIVHEIIKNHI